MIASEPTGIVEIPRAVRAAAGGDPIRPVWRNELGGVTFQLGTCRNRRFAKWSPTDGIDLGPEIERLAWAARWVTVPEVLSAGSDDEGSWIVTAGLPGENAVSAKWKADPPSAVAAIGRGLRALHDNAPIADCPFDWSQSMRLDDIGRRATTLDATTGPTWPSPPGARSGTTGRAGSNPCSRPTASTRTRPARPTTGCCGTSAPDLKSSAARISARGPPGERKVRCGN